MSEQEDWRQFNEAEKKCASRALKAGKLVKSAPTSIWAWVCVAIEYERNWRSLLVRYEYQDRFTICVVEVRTALKTPSGETLTKLYTGVSHCSHLDHYRRDKGEILAFRRAIQSKGWGIESDE